MDIEFASKEAENSVKTKIEAVWDKLTPRDKRILSIRVPELLGQEKTYLLAFNDFLTQLDKINEELSAPKTEVVNDTKDDIDEPKVEGDVIEVDLEKPTPKKENRFAVRKSAEPTEFKM